jgi:hypothetical protein
MITVGMVKRQESEHTQRVGRRLRSETAMRCVWIVLDSERSEVGDLEWDPAYLLSFPDHPSIPPKVSFQLLRNAIQMPSLLALATLLSMRLSDPECTRPFFVYGMSERLLTTGRNCDSNEYLKDGTVQKGQGSVCRPAKDLTAVHDEDERILRR